MEHQRGEVFVERGRLPRGAGFLAQCGRPAEEALGVVLGMPRFRAPGRGVNQIRADKHFHVHILACCEPFDQIAPPGAETVDPGFDRVTIFADADASNRPRQRSFPSGLMGAMDQSDSVSCR